MKKIIVASDTHGKNTNLKRVLSMHAPIDTFIFCGDGEGLEHHIEALLGEACERYMVRGNNDYFSRLPMELEFTLGAHKVFLTHGHLYGVSVSERIIAGEARERGCDLCIYGHTHRPFDHEVEGVRCLNPGSLSYPRQFDRNPSYILIEEEESGELHIHQAYLED